MDLRGGDTHYVPAEKAERLYRAGMILHPVTGQPPPPPRSAPSPGMQVVSDDRSYEDMARLAGRTAPPPPDNYWAKHPRFDVVPNDLTSRNGVL